jgi:RNA polymerase sigma-70 factor (ECF subfamily)
MSDVGRAALRELLVGSYSELKARLTRRLGSAGLASDVLQDTWLRLERASPMGPVRFPKSYLLRIAYNIALKRRWAALETVTLDDARSGLNLVDDAPDSAAIVESRADIVMLKEAVAELTPRQQDILFASRLDNVPLAELAVRHGISQRWVERGSCAPQCCIAHGVSIEKSSSGSVQGLARDQQIKGMMDERSCRMRGAGR